MRFIQYLTYAIVIIGAINWGLVGLFNFDLIAYLFTNMEGVQRILYSLVGLAAVVNLVLELTVCKSPSRCYAS